MWVAGSFLVQYMDAMAARTPKKPTNTPTETAGSAPELPAAVAKQYGLHHLVPKKGAPSSDAPAGKNDGDADTPPELAVLDEPETDIAVDEITAADDDVLLAVEDALADDQLPDQPVRRGFWKRIGHFFRLWATNPWAWWGTLAVLFAGIVAGTLIPPVRYFAFNTAGVRSSTSIKIIDAETRLPLRHVTVRIGNKKAETTINGTAILKGLRLGPQTLRIERVAFQAVTKRIVLGWGSNPQDAVPLTATGLRYTITVRDYVSDTPLAGVEATSEGLNALSDKNGTITLTVDDHEPQELPVTIAKAGYRTDHLTLKPSQSAVTRASLVPDAKSFYISRQSGAYDLYVMDIDGADKKVVLKATGMETSNTSLAVAPAGNWAAMVATRDAVRSKDGYLLQAITLVNADGSTATTLERAEQIQLIDWIGTKVLYQVTVASASAANSQRSRLISYDYTTNARVQLAAADRFNAVHVIKDTVYYAVGGGDPAVRPSFMKTKIDGSGRQTVWDKEVWTVWRTGYSTLALQVLEGWYDYAGTGTPAKANLPTTDSRQYVLSPDGSRAAWVDIRDGRGTVILTDLATLKDTELVAVGGLTYPLRWLNATTILYRVVVNGETADYVFSTAGGQPRKVADVTNTYGFTRY